MKIRTWFLALSLILLLGYGHVAVGTEAQTGGYSTTHIVQRGETLYRIALRYNTTVGVVKLSMNQLRLVQFSAVS